MVEDLLSFARPVVAQPRPIGAMIIVGRALTLFAQHPRRGSTEVDVAAAGEVTVRADLDLLATALVQMLINAAQAMRGSGRINLRVEAGQSSCAFVVTDEGPGIPADLKARLPRIFHTTKTQGLGLGLSIAQRVADQHEGRLTIQSEEGRGATVTLSVPRD
jgi:signal transduction histidine kinase